MDDNKLTEIFQNIHREYFFSKNRHITAKFHPYRSLRHTIEWNHLHVSAKVSIHFRNAPINILEILALILLAKIYKRRINKDVRKIYKEFTNELQKQLPQYSHKSSLNYRAEGEVFNLREIFTELNKKYFSNQLNVKHIGWSKRKSYHRLGFYDKKRKLLVISRIFDSDEVPLKVVNYLVYHEMLHILIPVRIKNGRRIMHPSEFKRLEKKFPEYDNINRWIKCNLKKL